MKCLVTGGMGFIGSNLTERLLSEGHEVLVIDNFSTSHIYKANKFFDHDNFKLEVYSIESNMIRGIFSYFKPDYVFHLAAKASVPKSFKNIKDFNRTNIDGTLNLLEASKNSNVKKFIFSSSSSVYGGLGPFPQKEDARLAPSSPYALQKMVGEEYCKTYFNSFGLDTCSLRYFNVYGPGQQLRGQYSAVIPIFLKNKSEELPVNIYGSGDQYRDFTYVDDVVSANIICAMSEKQNKGEVFNVCSGGRTSVNELARMVNISEINYLPERPGDVFSSRGDGKKIYEYNGFKVRVGMEMGLELTKSYYL